MSTDVSSPSLGTKSVGSVGFAGEEIAWSEGCPISTPLFASRGGIVRPQEDALRCCDGDSTMNDGRW
jgi:hypothetical protein